MRDAINCNFCRCLTYNDRFGDCAVCGFSRTNQDVLASMRPVVGGQYRLKNEPGWVVTVTAIVESPRFTPSEPEVQILQPNGRNSWGLGFFHRNFERLDPDPVKPYATNEVQNDNA